MSDSTGFITNLLKRLGGAAEAPAPPPDSLDLSTELERRTGFLRYLNLCWLLVGLVSLAALPFVAAERPIYAVMAAATTLTFVAVDRLLRWGRARAAAAVYIALMEVVVYGIFIWLVMSMGAPLAFQTQATVWVMMGVPVLLSGALVDRRLALGAALFNTLLFIVTRLRLAPEADPRPSLVIFWWLLALIVWLYERSLDGAFARVRAARALLTDERDFALQIINTMGQGLSVTDADSRLVLVNPALANFIGCEPPALLGKTPAELSLPEDGPLLVSQHSERIQGRTTTYEVRLRHRDGHAVPALVTAAPRVKAGPFAGAISVLTNLTDLKAQERRAAEASSLLRTVLDNLPDAVYAKDLQGRKTLTNAADLRTMNTRTPEEVLGKTDFDIYPPELAAIFSGRDRQILETGQPSLNEEHLFTDVDGRPRWLSTSKVPLRDEAGRIVGLVGIGRDITERRQSEEALRASEATFRSFVAESSEGIVLTDETGRIVEWNQAFEELTGLAREDIPSLAVWEAQHRIVPPGLRTPERLAQLRAAAEMLLRTGQLPAAASSVEVHVQDAAGRQRYLLQSTFPVRTSAGFRIGALLRDNTRRREMEEADRRRRVSLEKVVELGKAVTAVADLDGCLRRIHESIQTGLGFDRVGLYLLDAPAGMLRGSYGTDRDGRRVDERDYLASAATDPGWQAALRNPQGIHVDDDYDAAYHPAPDNEMAGVRQHVTVAAWTGQSIAALIAADNLISRRPFPPESLEALQLFAGYAGLAIQNARWNAELEARVRERTSQLEAANAELEAFAYTVSHDLRAPLRAINGFSQVVLEDYASQLPEEAQDYLGRVSAGAVRMNQLIEDLLAFSRLGRTPLQTRPVDPGHIAREAWEDARPRTATAAIAFGDLPACQADPALLRQVWSNLLANAVKFSAGRPDPEIEVGWRDGAYYVQDNGVGFDMQYAGKLFGVFQRLHSPHEFEGTGVGLANVKRIIARHGGRVWADSRPGAGATFYFTLPSPRERQP